MGATPIIIKYPLDLTGSASSNAIVNELHTVPRNNSRGFALDYGPFYSESLVITRPSTGEILKPHIDYIALHQYQEATLIAGQEICAAVLIINETIAEELSVSYQVVGGGFSSSVSVIQELVEALELDNRAVAWGDIIGKLEAFPAAPHYHDLDDFYGFEYMVSALDRIEAAILHGDYYDHELLRQRIANLRAELLQAIDDQAESQTLHLGDFANPHKVTKAQVGLGNVANFGTATNADGAAGTSTTLFMTPAAVFAAIIVKAGSMLEGHTSRVDNPHNTTKAQVGLGNVQNYGVASSADVSAGQTTGTASNTVYVTALRLVEYVANRLGNVANYGIATQAEAEVIDTGSSTNTKYMTPLRVLQAINHRVYNSFANHVNTSLSTNPHATTKADVGLGSVANYGVATQAEAQTMSDSASNSKYMTPWLVYRALITHLGRTDSASVLNSASAHINNTSNPHGTTAAQVGLGNVQNYSVASQVDAETGSSNGVYMTSLRTFQAIARYLANEGWWTVKSHVSRTDNPHGTTAAQVGLGNVQNFGTASQADAEGGSNNGVYMTSLRTFQAIARYLVNEGWSGVKAHVTNINNPHGTTAAQVGLGNVANYGVASQVDAETGSSNGVYMTSLRTFQAIGRYLANEGWGTVKAHVSRTDNPHGVNKWTVGLGNVANYPVASQAQVNSGAGGCYVTADTLHTRLGSITGGNTVGVLSGVISNGQTIPLPAGFAEWQCKWLVSTRNSNVNGNIWDVREGLATTHYQELCYCDGRVVTCVTKVYEDRNDSITTIAADANYIIVGVK